jgi:peptidoglycan-associated lipoprotein
LEFWIVDCGLLIFGGSVTQSLGFSELASKIKKSKIKNTLLPCYTVGRDKLYAGQRYWKFVRNKLRKTQEGDSAMKRSPFLSISIVVVAITLVLISAGCKKAKPVAPAISRTGDSGTPATRSSAVDPTAAIRANPLSIERGKSTTLTWETTNAAEVTIDNGIGTVEASGSRTVRPLESTTYKIRAVNNVAVAAAEVRVTVTDDSAVTLPPSSLISDTAWFDANMQDVLFDYNEFSIRADARKILQENARALAQRPNILITIEGYCDERGSERYNLVLGDRRANAARDYLITLGIAASRIETISYGEERPFCEERTEECWQLNRRARLMMR